MEPHIKVVIVGKLSNKDSINIRVVLLMFHWISLTVSRTRESFTRN